MTQVHDEPARLDLEAVTGWFARIYGATNGDLINIVRTDEWTGRFVPGHDLDEILRTITEYDSVEPAGIYHRITTVAGVPGGRYKRGDAALSHLLPGFWADIDVDGPGHKSKGTLPPDREAGMRIVTNSSLPEPSLWVDSGGGLYPWWLLDQPKEITPKNIEAVSRLSEDVQEELQRSARELGLECAPMADLARVLRIPGTVNRKVTDQPTMCRIIQDTGAVYSIREIREAVPRASAKKINPNAGNTDTQAVLNSLPEGPPCPVMARKLDAVSETMREAEVGNRHKTTLSAIGGIVRMGNVGHAGAADALEDLELVFQEIKPEADDRAWDGLVSYVLEHEEIIPEPEKEYCGTLCFDSAPVPAGDDEEGEERGRDGRIRVNVSNRDRAGRQLRELIGSGPLSGMFHREGELVYTPRIGEEGYVPPPDGEDGPAQIHTIEALDLKSMIEVEMAVGGSKRRTKIVEDENGEERRETTMEWEPKMLPMEVASQLRSVSRMRLGVPNLRVLKSVTHTPVIRRDGSIFAVPDYDPRSKMLYLPDEALDIPEIGDVDHAAITAAVALLSSIVEEFPFVTETHRANWFGAMFTPLTRSILPPPYPAFVMDAPSPGSGKSLLEKIIRMTHGGVFRSGWPGEEAEVGKSIMSTLISTTSPVVTFDNVRGRINSPIFEGLLTSDTYSHRQLGSTKNMVTPNDRLWMITANNAEIGGDLARRFYWVTIDPGIPRPFERTQFKLDLNTWVPANRGRILHAMLTIIRGWVLEQRPTPAPRRSDSCAVWDAGMNDLLSWAGISEEFGKAEERHQDSDDDREWFTFLSEIHRVMGGERFKIRDLVDKIKDSGGDVFGSESGGLDPSVLPGDMADRWSRVGMGSHAGFTKSLGRWTKNRAGRYVGDLVLKIFPDPKRGDSYQVHRVFQTGQTDTN